MTFPSEENFCYLIIPSEPLVQSARRLQFESPDPTNSSRIVNRVVSNVPGVYEVASSGNRRRVATPNLDIIAPFTVQNGYTGFTYRQVLTTFPPLQVPVLSDFVNQGIYIGERDFYKLYLREYLGRMPQAGALKGIVGATELSDLAYLFNLVGSGFVSGSILPELPYYR